MLFLKCVAAMILEGDQRSDAKAKERVRETLLGGRGLAKSSGVWALWALQKVEGFFDVQSLFLLLP